MRRRALRHRRGPQGARGLEPHLRPTDAGASTQISIINSAVQQKPDAIIIADNDPNAVAPALKQAEQRGVKIVGWTPTSRPRRAASPSTRSRRSWSARARSKLISKQIGGKGEIAILSATANATNQNAWIKDMKEELKKPEYKDIKLVKVAYGDDDDQKSFQETQGLLQAYPNLKGIISPTTVGVSAAARYLSSSPKKGKIKTDGAGPPTRCASSSRTARSTGSSCGCPKDVGYLAGQAAAALVAGPITGKEGEKFKAGRLGDARSARTARSCSGRRRLQQGEHRRLQLGRRTMTVADRHSLESAALHPARAARPGRGVRDRPGRLLAAVRRRAASASRATSGAWRSASRDLGGDVVSGGLVDTATGARDAGDLFASAQVDLVLCHAVTYATSSQVLPAVQAAGVPGGPARAAAHPLAGLRRARTRASGSRTARPAASRRSPGRSPARGSPTTPSRARSRTTSARGTGDRRLGARRRRRAQPAALAASASSGTPIPGCSTCTRTSRRSTGK